MNKSLFTILALLCIVSIQAKKNVVIWDKPNAICNIFRTGTKFQVNKMEFKSDETVMHIEASYIPKNWIKFASTSVLKDEIGREYAIISGEPTCKGELRMQVDSLFTMPESGKANIALHFQPLHIDTKRVDFIEGHSKRAFRIWNIRKADDATQQPEEWRNLKSTSNETLPNAKVGKGKATRKVRMIDYRPEMKGVIKIKSLKLQTNGKSDKTIKFGDDGCILVEIPTALPCPVIIGIDGLIQTNCLIAPGETVECLINPYIQGDDACIFKGYMARTNNEYSMEWKKYTNEKFSNETLFSALKKCTSPESRFTVLIEKFHNTKNEIDKRTDICDATKALLRMDVEANYFTWIKGYANQYASLCIEAGIEKEPQTYDELVALVEKYRHHLSFIDFAGRMMDASAELYSAPYAPCSESYWQFFSGVYNRDTTDMTLNLIENIYATKLVLGGKSDNSDYAIYTQHISDPGCLALVEEYRQEEIRRKEQLNSKQNVYFHKLDSVAPEKIIDTIMQKYKGKTVLVDVWATWCGPCRQGHAELAPLKKKLKDKNIVWVYISAPSSNVSQWQQMITDIPGEHYFINNEQYEHIMRKLYESDGIPTYAIYNTNGTMTFKCAGFPGIDKIRTELEKAM